MVSIGHWASFPKFHKVHVALEYERLACMQWKRVKWCSLKFLTTDRNSRKKMMSGANWLL